MTNLRVLAERHLAISLEGRWGLPVDLISPDGVTQTLRKDSTEQLVGQVLYDIRRNDPETGEAITVSVPVVTLRRSSLDRIPQPGENWVVVIPESVTDTTRVQFMMSRVRPPEGGKSIGYIRIYLQQVEQS